MMITRDIIENFKYKILKYLFVLILDFCVYFFSENCHTETNILPRIPTSVSNLISTGMTSDERLQLDEQLRMVTFTNVLFYITLCLFFCIVNTYTIIF